MEIKLLKDDIALVTSDVPLLTDTQSALDLMATVRFETDCTAFVIPKQAVDESFFDLRSGIAGEILQKFANYHTRMAIAGDFSGYTSKALRDFIRESNRGRHFFFVGTVEEALELLEKTTG